MEKTVEVIATLWFDTESGRPPTVLESKPLTRCGECVYHNNDICMMWSGGERELRTGDAGFCHFAEAVKNDD